MLWLQFAVLLAAILIGSRLKGIGLGVMGMVGMLVFILLFHMQPADPPIEVMLIILSVVSAAATLQAAGGMDYLVQLAEKILRKNPSHITFLGPLVTYMFTLFAGTAHINYSILPIIAEVATRKRIRPERPLSISVISSHLALTASPVSAATATLLTIVRDNGFQLTDILKVCIPATLIGVFAGILVQGGGLPTTTAFSNRLRYLISLTHPLLPDPKWPQACLANEVLLQFGKTILNNPFDQLRLFAGIRQTLGKGWSYDLGYMMVYQQKATGNQYDRNHTLRLFFYYTLNKKGKPVVAEYEDE